MTCPFPCISFTIHTRRAAEAQSHPGPGAYKLTPDPPVRRPKQKKGFSRDQKNTFGASFAVCDVVLSCAYCGIDYV